MKRLLLLTLFIGIFASCRTTYNKTTIHFSSEIEKVEVTPKGTYIKFTNDKHVYKVVDTIGKKIKIVKSKHKL